MCVQRVRLKVLRVLQSRISISGVEVHVVDAECQNVALHEAVNPLPVRLLPQHHFYSAIVVYFLLFSLYCRHVFLGLGLSGTSQNLSPLSWS